MCAELIQLGFERIAVRTHLRGIYLTSRRDVLWLGGEAQVPELQLVVGHPNLVRFDVRHERLTVSRGAPAWSVLTRVITKRKWLRAMVEVCGGRREAVVVAWGPSTLRKKLGDESLVGSE